MRRQPFQRRLLRRLRWACRVPFRRNDSVCLASDGQRIELEGKRGAALDASCGLGFDDRSARPGSHGQYFFTVHPDWLAREATNWSPLELVLVLTF